MSDMELASNSDDLMLGSVACNDPFPARLDQDVVSCPNDLTPDIGCSVLATSLIAVVVTYWQVTERLEKG